MIENFLTDSRILIQAHADDWQQLIDIVGGLMEDNGDIETTYIEAMRQAVVDLGPYVVIAPGVALLHARPESGVKQIGMVFVTLKDGVNFGSKNDPVLLAIGLSAKDHESHIELLRDLATTLQNKKNLVQIFNTAKKDDFIQIMKP